MTYFENGVNRGSQIVLEGCHRVGVQTCAVWEASGGAELAVCVSFQMQPARLPSPAPASQSVFVLLSAAY